MIPFIIAVHVLICILLIVIILIQSGRGGGLVDTFQGVESMFGTKTNSFLTRATTVLSVAFFFTCLGLAFFSAQQSKSLMRAGKYTGAQAPQGGTSSQAVPQAAADGQLPAPGQAAPQPQEKSAQPAQEKTQEPPTAPKAN